MSLILKHASPLLVIAALFTQDFVNENKGSGYGFVVMGLSRIGFNRTKDKALVYVTYTLDTMDEQNAKQRFFVLTKTGDQWVVQGTVGVIKRINE